LKIERRVHDSKECSCIFTVQFYHDKSQVIFDIFASF
jgi:hypothetical protein